MVFVGLRVGSMMIRIEVEEEKGKENCIAEMEIHICLKFIILVYAYI